MLWLKPFLQVHNKLNNTHLALMHYSWAMDLDPKVQHKFHIMHQLSAWKPSERCWMLYMCVDNQYDFIQGANSQVKDALDPALNRVGQELGWDVCLVALFFTFLLHFVFVICLFWQSLNFKYLALFMGDSAGFQWRRRTGRSQWYLMLTTMRTSRWPTHCITESESDGRIASQCMRILRIVKLHFAG